MTIEKLLDEVERRRKACVNARPEQFVDRIRNQAILSELYSLLEWANTSEDEVVEYDYDPEIELFNRGEN